MLTVLTGLISALSYAFSDMLSQRVSRRAGVIRVLLWVLVTGMVISLPLALIIDGLPHGDDQWRAVGYSAVAGMLYLGAFLSLLGALKVGDLSLVAALSSLQGLFTTLFAIIGGEKVTSLLALGLALAIVGGALAAVQGRSRTAKGSGWAVLSGLLFALTMVLYDRAGDISWLSQAAFSRLASIIVFVPVALLVLRRSRPHTDPARPAADDDTVFGRTERLTCVGSGILEIIGLGMVTVSIQLGPLSVAGVTASQFGTVAVILGLVFLKERPRKHQLVGVACTLVAVSLLAALG